MQITAKIFGLKYSPKLVPALKNFLFNKNLDLFDVNELPSYCFIKTDNFSFGFSKWVSPKRSRSYPYERIYNILSTSKRITVIPIIKDEGANGDRDFIQWDTVSLMNLLDVFVIFAYYKDATPHPNKAHKITNQQFDNMWVKNKILEVMNYHSSALHWNLKEIQESFPLLIEKTKIAYQNISRKYDMRFHSFNGIDTFAKQFLDGVQDFMKTSRLKAKQAQQREVLTVQPKEMLDSQTKAKITIENYLGGKYYFTTDEIKIKGNHLYLIEDKHSKHSILPSLADIKDGLLKMILYTNLAEVRVNNIKYQAKPILRLTSEKLNTDINRHNYKQSIQLSAKQKKILDKLFEEAEINNFEVIITSQTR